MLELSDLVQGATDLFHAARSQVFGVAHTVGEAAADICHDAVGTASHLYDRAGRTANTASGYIQRVEQGVQKGVHAAEEWLDEGTHSLAARFDHVPAMGPAARMMADRVTMGAQLLGGIGLGVTTMVGGMAHSVVHPIDTALGLEVMLEMGQISSIKLWSEQPEPRRKDQEELLGIPRGRSLVFRSTMSACPIAASGPRRMSESGRAKSGTRGTTTGGPSRACRLWIITQPAHMDMPIMVRRRRWPSRLGRSSPVTESSMSDR